MIELTVKISNEEKRLTKKHLVYEEIVLSREEEYLIALVDEALEDFEEVADEVRINIMMVW